ncbi:T9SS type A sorting domain-containing protein [Flavobacteriaceae bacterium]|nr:T9SS type A sorting domain-containing protein [Flavobacteriaceae bacterium]MDB4196317.1 T9SS type A sorting domain-containing protein [Flavobacteriaceae bacterium]MDC1320816.1 T9SS type A sorting domain-containing protein [Flavobacteriaceae bacterium]
MKRYIFSLLMFFSFSFLIAQNGDSCQTPIEINAGNYYINNIDGDSYSLNCTELDYNNSNLEWFSYSSDQNIFVTVTSDLESNQNDDTRLHIYEGSCDNLVCVVGDDDGGIFNNGFLSTATFQAIAGVTYYIAWDSFWSNSSFDFQIIESDTPPASTYTSFEHHGIDRDYIYYEPEGLEENSPLVFVMHGYSGDAENISNYSNMNDIADEYGFAVCYPRGTVDGSGNRFWNVGYDFHPNETVDDVDFLKELAIYLQSEHNLNADKTFATGMSNGGEMCYMLACQASETFKAVVSVAGMMLQEIMDTCNPSNLISIFEIHGINDNVNYYNGDPTSSGGWGVYPSIPETIDYWAEMNNCNEFSTEDLPNTNTTDGSYVVSEKNYGADNNNEVWLYKVYGGGHDWPGTQGANMDIDASLEAWLFFNHIITNSLAVNYNEESMNSLYPNPAKNSFSISSSNEFVSYVIYSISGDKVLIGSNKINIDISSLSSGIYFVNILENNLSSTKKLIVK